MSLQKKRKLFLWVLLSPAYCLQEPHSQLSRTLGVSFSGRNVCFSLYWPPHVFLLVSRGCLVCSSPDGWQLSSHQGRVCLGAARSGWIKFLILVLGCICCLRWLCCTSLPGSCLCRVPQHCSRKQYLKGYVGIFWLKEEICILQERKTGRKSISSSNKRARNACHLSMTCPGSHTRGC